MPIARRVQARFHGLTAIDELMQRGMAGLLAADVDPERTAVSARAYLRLRIWGAMLDPIRRECRRQEISQNCDTVFPSRSEPRALGGILRRLPVRQRQILELRMQGYTQAETGMAFHISQGRVSRLEARAVQTLRHLLN